MGKSVGFEVKTYRYYDPAIKGINFAAFCEDLRVNTKMFRID